MHRLNKKLVDGYQKEMQKTGLQAYMASAQAANGALMFFAKPIRNYRDWLNDR